MPMKIEKRDQGHLALTMTFGPPTVYFDNWAIRAFSDDRALQDRFVELLHRKAATLRAGNRVSGLSVAQNG